MSIKKRISHDRVNPSFTRFAVDGVQIATMESSGSGLMLVIRGGRRQIVSGMDEAVSVIADDYENSDWCASCRDADRFTLVDENVSCCDDCFADPAVDTDAYMVLS